MAFPTSIPSNTDPTSGNTLNSPSHSQLHQSHNAEIVAAETKIGTGASTPVVNRLLYGTGTGTSAWTQLTSSQLAGTITDETGSGSLVFATSPTITTPSITSPSITTPAIVTSINDVNGNEVIKTPATAAATNEITVTNAANGNAPLISATGSSDANVNLNLQPKGTTGIAQILDGNGNEVIKAGVATASAVNEVTVTNAATTAAPSISVTGNDANINLALTPKGNGLVKSAVLRQDDTTNTYQKGNTVTLTGWGVGIPGAVSTFSETVTFGVTFTARPIVLLTFGGDNTVGTLTYGAGTPARKKASVWATTITTINFLARLDTSDATNWTAGDSVFYQWIAIGEIA